MEDQKQHSHKAAEYEHQVEAEDSVTEVTGFVTDADQLTWKYFVSKNFIGTYMAQALGFSSAIAAFAYIAPVLSNINEDLGPSPSYVWISYVYNTCFAVAYPLIGVLSDLFGRRYFMIGGCLLSAIGAVTCSRAQNIPTVIGGNVLMGIGSTTQYCYSFVLGELVPVRYRFITSVSLNLWSIPSGIFAPVIARSFLLTAASWRGIYYYLAALNALVTILWVLFYFPPNFQQKHGSDRKMYWIKHFDYGGSFLFISGIVVFLFGLSAGGSVYPWKSAPVILMIVLGFMTLIATGIWEVLTESKESILPPRIFRNVPWLAASVVQGLSGGTYYAGAIVIPLQVSLLYNNGNNTYMGIITAMPAWGQFAGAVLGGCLATRIPNHRLQNIVCFMICTIAVGCCALITPDNKGLMLALIFLTNAPAGWLDLISIVDASIVVKNQQDLGTAGSISCSIRSAITSIVSVVYATVLTNGLKTKIPEMVPPVLVKAGLPISSIPAMINALGIRTPEAYSSVPGISPEIIDLGLVAYKEAYVSSFRLVYLVGIAFGALGLLTAFFTPNTDHLLNAKVAATLHNDKTRIDEEKTEPRVSERGLETGKFGSPSSPGPEVSG